MNSRRCLEAFFNELLSLGDANLMRLVDGVRHEQQLAPRFFAEFDKWAP